MFLKYLALWTVSKWSVLHQNSLPELNSSKVSNLGSLSEAALQAKVQRAKPMDKERKWAEIAPLKEVCNGPHSHLCIGSEGHTSTTKLQIWPKRFQIWYSHLKELTQLMQQFICPNISDIQNSESQKNCRIVRVLTYLMLSQVVPSRNYLYS